MHAVGKYDTFEYFDLECSFYVGKKQEGNSTIGSCRKKH